MKKKNVTEKNTAGKHISFWMESVEPLHFASLKKDVKADVVIIGAGIAGLSVAYRLCQLNKKVIVIDDGAMGGGETGHTSAHFVNALDNRYYKLEKMFGEREPSLPLRVIAKQLISLRKLLQRKKLIATFEEFQDIYFFIPLIIEKILIGNLMQPPVPTFLWKWKSEFQVFNPNENNPVLSF